MHPDTATPPQNPPSDTDPFQLRMFSQAAPERPDHHSGDRNQVGDTAAVANAHTAQPEATGD
jgi:hypothetical protein